MLHYDGCVMSSVDVLGLDIILSIFLSQPVMWNRSN